MFPTPSGRARFVPTPHRAVAEEVDAGYPLRLTTGRLRDQWHAMSRTGTIAGLFAHEPEPRVTVHPEDLSRAGINDGDLVQVLSRRGHIYLQAAADPDLMRGLVFIPMHWGARFLGGESRRGVNELTLGALDPSSRQPELKHCAVRVESAQLPWRLVTFGNSRDVFSLVSRLEPLMGAAPYAVRTLIGRDSPGVRFAIAAEKAPPEEILEEIDAVFGLDAPEAARYDDSKHNIGRRILLEGNTVRAVRLSGDTRSEPWLKELWERAAPVKELRHYLLLPVETPPGLRALRGRTVCNCFNVSEREIDAFLAKSNSMIELQASLKCGTNCGSCLPELRRKVSLAKAFEAVALPLTAAKV